MELEFFFRIGCPGSKVICFEILSKRSQDVDEDMFWKLVMHVNEDPDSSVSNDDYLKFYKLTKDIPKVNYFFNGWPCVRKSSLASVWRALHVCPLPLLGLLLFGSC